MGHLGCFPSHSVSPLGVAQAGVSAAGHQGGLRHLHLYLGKGPWAPPRSCVEKGTSPAQPDPMPAKSAVSPARLVGAGVKTQEVGNLGFVFFITDL